jgi:hypothetical protein
MSYIQFDSPDGTVQIGGRERARMGLLIDEIAWALEDRGNLSGPDDELRKLRYQYSADDNFGQRLGWVCLIGDDVTKLVAHIHGQCEIHGWVHPDDGPWFAGLVEAAVERGLLGDDARNHYGSWSEVAEMARTLTGPMASSYSVTESWPDVYGIAEHTDLWTPADPDDPYESWEELAVAERHRIADEALPLIAPRWHPEEWGTHWAALVTGHRPYAEASEK